MTRRLLNHGITTSRRLVSEIQRIVDPDGVQNRRHRNFTRRVYSSKGPNFVIHIDGYDKLKRFGFPIHGAICGFSRRILWLKAINSNNDPHVVATLFMEYVNDIKAVPRCVRMDAGTENVLVEDIQKAFRWEHHDSMSGEYSVLKGSSHSNQRIERWWLSNRQGGCQFWIDYFKDMESAGLISTSNPYHIECCRISFIKLIQKDLDRVRTEWNQHYVRRSNLSDSPNGKPDLMFFMPHLFDIVDYKVQVSQDDIDQIMLAYNTSYTAFSEDVEEIIATVRRTRHLDEPDSVLKAQDLYGHLTALQQ